MTYRLWINETRIVMVRMWQDGTVEVATRLSDLHVWGPLVTLKEEEVAGISALNGPRPWPEIRERCGDRFAEQAYLDAYGDGFVDGRKYKPATSEQDVPTAWLILLEEAAKGACENGYQISRSRSTCTCYSCRVWQTLRRMS